MLMRVIKSMCFWPLLSWGNQYYATNLEDALWMVKGNGLQCTLTHPIEQYGEFVVTHAHTQNPEVIFRSWLKLPDNLEVAVYAASPHWKANASIEPLFVTRFKEANLKLGVAQTQHILAELKKGKKIQFKYKLDNKVVHVDVLPVRYLKAYTDYMVCTSQLLNFNYKDVASKNIYFDSNSKYITEEGKTLLNQVITYVHADASIREITIDGFADNSGRQGYNMYLSEQRAKEVKAYFESYGVDSAKIKVNWHGYLNPKTTNDTVVGKAMNRRVQVQIFR